MFTLCKPRYQAVLLKQIWGYLNQRYAVYQTAVEKMHLIHSNLKFLSNFFQMTMLFFAYVVTIWGQLHFTGNFFFTVNISAKHLLQSTYYLPRN